MKPQKMINKPYDEIAESTAEIMIRTVQEVMVEHVYVVFKELVRILEETEEENTHETETDSK